VIFLGATLVLAANGFVCVAQVEQGAIAAAITDATGASIRATKVTATKQATGALATSDATVDGYYKIPYLRINHVP
jgi:hypothetical protein